MNALRFLHHAPTIWSAVGLLLATPTVIYAPLLWPIALCVTLALSAYYFTNSWLSTAMCLTAWGMGIHRHITMCHNARIDCATVQQIVNCPVLITDTYQTHDNRHVISVSPISYENRVPVELIGTNFTIYARQIPATLKPGMAISLRSLRPTVPMHPEIALNMIRKGTQGTVFTNKLFYRTITDHSISIQEILIRIRTYISALMTCKMCSTSATLLETIFLGAQTHDATTPHVKHSFKKWGIIHYLARSGLHIMLLVGAMAYAIRLSQLSLSLSIALQLLLFALYALFSYTSISFMRALFSALFMLWATMTRTRTRLMHVLCTTTTIILLNNPLHAPYLDFQLSFGLTFALALFAEATRALKTVRNNIIA